MHNFNAMNYTLQVEKQGFCDETIDCKAMASIVISLFSSQRGKKWVDILVVNNDCLWL